MEYSKELYFVILGFLIYEAAANPCEEVRFSSSYGAMQSPGYPEVKEKYDCKQYVSFPPGGGLIKIKVAYIELYHYNYTEENTCPMLFEFGVYTPSCMERETPCIVQYNSKDCTKLAATFQDCKTYNTTRGLIPVRIKSEGAYGLIWNSFRQDNVKRYPKGVKLTYKFMTCPRETTTRTSTTTTTTTTKITSTEATNTTSVNATTVRPTPTNAALTRTAAVSLTTDYDSEAQSNATNDGKNSSFSSMRSMRITNLAEIILCLLQCYAAFTSFF